MFLPITADNDEWDTDSDVKIILETFRKNSQGKIISAHLSINSTRKKFDQPGDMIKGNIDVRMMNIDIRMMAESKLKNCAISTR